MTTTLALWQIVVLTLLILSLGVILRRLVILIALVVSHHWSELNHSPIAVDDKNRHQTGLNVSHSGTMSDGPLVRPYVPEGYGDVGVTFAPEEEFAEYTGTGITPGGVSFVPAVPERRSVAKLLVPGRRKDRRPRRQKSRGQ